MANELTDQRKLEILNGLVDAVKAAQFHAPHAFFPILENEKGFCLVDLGILFHEKAKVAGIKYTLFGVCEIDLGWAKIPAIHVQL